MSEENEVKQDGEVYNDHSVDNSVHHAVNLWPVMILGIAAGCMMLCALFADQIKEKQKGVPKGKEYSAVGAVITCVPGQPFGNGKVFRAIVRTPDDLFFDVYFRSEHEPLSAGMAIGTLKYHECGKVDGNTVHCFDSFKMAHEGLAPLDQNGKPMVWPLPAQKK